MEGSCFSAGFCPGDALNLSNFDVLEATSQNCGGDHSRNPALNGCTLWTNEEHNSYLDCLEMSFVKQLHQSMGLVAKQNKKTESISQRQQANIHTAHEQSAGLWHTRNEHFPHVYQYDFHKLPTRTILDDAQNFIKCSPAQTHSMLDCSNLPGARKHKKGEGSATHGFTSSSENFSTDVPFDDDLVELMKEGIGQNFPSRDNSSNCRKNRKQRG